MEDVKIEEGGSAFPCVVPDRDTHGQIRHYEAGMSLRDYFAAKVTAAFIGNSTLCAIGDDLNRYADYGYKVADAMLVARKAKVAK